MIPKTDFAALSQEIKVLQFNKIWDGDGRKGLVGEGSCIWCLFKANLALWTLELLRVAFMIPPMGLQWLNMTWPLFSLPLSWFKWDLVSLRWIKCHYICFCELFQQKLQHRCLTWNVCKTVCLAGLFIVAF